ncbi:unnamed protein product [Paramecium pentaurelia]|uniref:Uncharacterized protein n=1 Tax=Paramecium pentaurelia TaxID=43138 RepID=A0A8S1S8V9_9CILI|nr:unnamed protein product [Paramecium pentaurelia]
MRKFIKTNNIIQLFNINSQVYLHSHRIRYINSYLNEMIYQQDFVVMIMIIDLLKRQMKIQLKYSFSFQNHGYIILQINPTQKFNKNVVKDQMIQKKQKQQHKENLLLLFKNTTLRHWVLFVKQSLLMKSQRLIYSFFTNY